MIYKIKTIHRKLKIKQHETHQKPGGELGYSGRVNSSCSTSGTCHVTFVTNPVIGHEWGKALIVIT